MRPILALDLATKTGWAFGPPGSPSALKYGTFRVQGATHGAKFSRYYDWLDGLVSQIEPRLIFMEKPFLDKKRNLDAARMLLTLIGLTDLIAHKRNVAIREINNATLKKFFTGSGRAEKRDVIFRCRSLGFDPKDDNAADAIACWHYADDWFRQQRDARQKKEISNGISKEVDKVKSRGGSAALDGGS